VSGLRREGESAPRVGVVPGSVDRGTEPLAITVRSHLSIVLT
jgi:hypothetical protein